MKSTKKRFLSSVLALIMCVCMLIGTTFAWFTDSVQSGRNKIVAGNLDVELTHSNAKDTDADVDGATGLFSTDVNGEDILWEPGVICYENFTVKNVGNLALKYALNLNIFDKNAMDGHDLSEVIKVATVPGGFSGERADAQALDFDTLADFQQTGSLEAGASDEPFGVVLYWEPTDHDNDYNVNNGKTTDDGQPLFIEFGINLVATQLESEFDSFDNTYDANATYMANDTETSKAGEKTKFVLPITPAVESGKSTTVEFEEDALAEGNYKLELRTENNLFELKSNDGKNAVSIDLKLYDKDGALTTAFADGKKATITTYVTKGMEGVTVKYNGTGSQPKLISYNKDTGELIFSTDHFSEYQVDTSSAAYIKETDLAYDTFEGALTAANAMQKAATVVMLNDCSYAKNGTGLWNITNSMTIEGMGHSLNGYGSRIGNKTTLAINNGGSSLIDVALKNVTITNTANAGRAIETRGNISSFTLDKVVINATGTGGNQGLTVGGNQSSKATVNIIDSTIMSGQTGYSVLTFNPVEMTVKGSTIEGWTSLYFKGMSGSAGSATSQVSIRNSKLGSFNYLDSVTNDFATIVYEDGNILLDIYDSEILAGSVGTLSRNSIFSFRMDQYPASDKKDTINIYGDSKVLLYGTSQNYVGIDVSAIDYAQSGKIDFNCYSGYYSHDITEYLGNNCICTPSTDMPDYNFVVKAKA